MTSIYSDRVYGEQPIGLWSLDIDYLTMISREDSDVLGWSGSATSRYISYVRDRIPPCPGPGEVTKVRDNSNSVEVVNLAAVNKASESVDIGLWVYSPYAVNSFEVAVVDGDNVDIAPSYILDDITVNKWHPVTATFPVSGVDMPYGIRIRAEFSDVADHYVLIGQVMVGQNVGSALLTSDGAIPVSPPQSSGLQYFGINGVVPVNEYGFGTDVGYAVAGERLMGRNRGIPMVYGDSSSTHLLPGPNPALVLPGKGAFHQSGRYRDLTLEAWVRVQNSGSSDCVRIFGPIASNDGVWVKENTICLVVGSQVVSFDAGNIFRPLLISIVFMDSGVLLRVNGQDIGTVSAVDFPNSASYNSDWIAFYCPEGFLSVEIGPVAVFPYALSSIVSKRHFVWGQAVELSSPDTASYSRSYARFYSSVRVPFSDPYRVVTSDASEVVFGSERPFVSTQQQRMSILPLSSFAKVSLDDGGRASSKVDFIQVSTSGTGHTYYASIQKTSSRKTKIIEDYATTEPFVDGVTSMSPGILYEVRDKSLLTFNVKYPHLYSINMYVVTVNNSLFVESDPVVSLSSVINDSFSDLGSSGDMRSIPFSREGNYYVKNNPASYRLGTDGGSALGLGDNGLEVLDGNVMVFGRRPQTFLGIQLWVKFNGSDGEAELIFDDATVSIAILSSGDSGTMSVGQNDQDIKLSFYQDGNSVSVPTLYRGVWTSIGIALESPLELDTAPRLIVGQGLSYKNVIFYGGETLSRLVAFRTWGQLTDSTWGDLDEMTWQEILTLEASAPTVDIGKLYRGSIGANRYVVGDNPQNLFLVDNGMSVVMREEHIEADDSVTLSVPSWKTLGTYN